ncbi:hypothetical protein, partial [Klebsiella quasivariicola]|uniref:hypothetical protein n=1 Tax=Klebsiella quasivariicola TaxID=2026240 RepID=UPI001C8FF2A0
PAPLHQPEKKPQKRPKMEKQRKTKKKSYFRTESQLTKSVLFILKISLQKSSWERCHCGAERGLGADLPFFCLNPEPEDLFWVSFSSSCSFSSAELSFFVTFPPFCRLLLLTPEGGNTLEHPPLPRHKTAQFFFIF